MPAALTTRRTATLAGLALVLCAALLYGATLDRWLTWGNLAGGDLITHQYAQVQARPSNAPGYPLYTMGGWLWFHGVRTLASALTPAAPNPVPILSAYSTLWALLALWLLYCTLCFLTSRRYAPHSPWGEAGTWPLAWLLSAFCAVTYFFWFYATTTEQYSSAVAQTIAIVYVYLLWSEADTRTPGAYGVRARPGGLLILLALLCGTSLAHMLTVALIVPPLVAVVIWQRPRLLRNGPLLAAVIAAALLPLLAYLYVYVRGAQHPEWWGAGNWRSAADWFWAFVSTAQGREELAWGLEPGRAFFGNGFPALIWQELSAPLLLVALAGIAWLRRQTALLLYTTLALYLAFCWAYRYGNWYQVILPAYPLLLLGGAGAANWLAARPWAMRRRWLQPALLALLAALVIWRFAASWPRTDSRRYPADEALGRAAVLLNANPPHTAALFANPGEAAALDYVAHIWGLRPDLTIIGSSHAATALAQGRPLLATWEMADTLVSEMGGAPSVQTLNPDWARIGAPATLPSANLNRTLLAADDGAPLIVLAGYDLTPSPSAAPVTDTVPALDVTLNWRLPSGAWPAGVALSLRPTHAAAFIPDPAGAPGAIIQVDAAAPLHGLAALAPEPTAINDAYRLRLPAPLPAGADGLALILYRAQDGGFETLADVRLPLH